MANLKAIDLPRAVLDTNVFVSAALSKNPRSPTREVIERWRSGEFLALVCVALAEEIVEKLIEYKMSADVIARISDLLARLAQWVEVPPESIEPLLSDPDDDVVLACAVIGEANFLITYDPHFDSLHGEYRGVKILKAIPFLEILRQLPA
jgi:putative PIN family toxin of toxin-antitoxin system